MSAAAVHYQYPSGTGQRSAPSAWTQLPSPPPSEAPETSGYQLDRERLDRVYTRLRQLCELEPGWDGYNAERVDYYTAMFAAMVVGPLLHQQMPEPFVAPLSYGGIQFEWHGHEADLEVEFRAPYDVEVLFVDEAAHEVWEFPLRRGNMQELASAVHKLKERALGNNTGRRRGGAKSLTTASDG